MRYKHNGEWVETPATLETIEREVFGLRYEVKDLKNILFKQHQEREQKKETIKETFLVVGFIILVILAIVGALAISKGLITF